MEIKIVCACGTKYKFDVEPLNGQMPWPVRCPTCNTESTAEANDIIAQDLAPSPPEPIASTEAAAAPAPRLRVSTPRPVAATSMPQAAGASEMSSPAPGRPVRRIGREAPVREIGLARNAKILLGVLCLVFVVSTVGYKWFKRLRFVANVASAVGEASVGSTSPEGQQNLWADDCVVLIIKHTNETEVAQACVDFWRDQLKRKLTVLSTNELFAEAGQIGIVPAHNGCVQMVGGLTWPKPQFEALTQYLSQRFNTLAIETRDVDFSGAYIFGVFEQGEKKFRAEMELQGKNLADLEEVVKTEGDAWALAHGYKPGPEGFKEFHLGDADAITKHVGIKLWNWQTSDHYLLLSESGAGASQPRPRAGPTPANPRRVR